MSKPASMSRLAPVRTGSVARSYVDLDGKRLFAPWKVSIEVQMTKDVKTNETLWFYLYAQDGKEAAQIASRMLTKSYVTRKANPDGFPKPVGFGVATPIDDKEFSTTFTQALSAGQEVLRTHSLEDPTGFHIKNNTTKIYVPISSRILN